MNEVVLHAIIADSLTRLSWERSTMGDNALFNKINATGLNREIIEKHPKIARMIKLRGKVESR